MNRKTGLLLVLIVAVFELAFLTWTRADYRSALLDGEEYEVPAAIEFQGNFYERNYISVSIPMTEAKWDGERDPEPGETIYISVHKGDKGALVIDNARLTEPSGSYIQARALHIIDDTVHFHFPADRMYMAPEQLKKLSVVELSERVQVPDSNGKSKTVMKNEITALIRVKDGRVAVSRVLANGGPVEQIFTTVGKNLSVKYATSGGEKDQYNEKRFFTADDRKQGSKEDANEQKE